MRQDKQRHLRHSLRFGWEKEVPIVMSNTFKYYLNSRTTVVIVMCVVVAGTAEGSPTLHYDRLKGDLSMP